MDRDPSAAVPPGRGSSANEYGHALVEIPCVILPPDVEVYFNGRRLLPRSPVARFEETLPTVVADDEAVLRQTRRKTIIAVYEPLPGEPAMIFEMGIRRGCGRVRPTQVMGDVQRAGTRRHDLPECALPSELRISPFRAGCC